jgi:imidazolonepropionase-like amidohydrolase
MRRSFNVILQERFAMVRCKLVLLLLCIFLPISALAQTTAIRAGRVVDPEKGTVANNQIILVEKGKITSIGSDVAIPAGATVIDLSHASVLPGLFDAHTHLCMSVIATRDAGNYYYTTLNDPDSFRAIQGVVNARTMLESGFTTVRDVGNEGNYACTSLRRAIDQKMVPGPTILNAGRIIAPYGGQFHLQPDKQKLGEPEYFYADTHDEMIKGIRENIHYGARVIKIVVDDQRYIYSVDDIRFMVAEAARSGLKLAAHCWTAAGARNASEAGVASIEHGRMMSDEVLQIAKRNNVALVGTEFLALAYDKAGHDIWVDRLRRANKIGVTLVYGTDVVDYVEGQTRGTLAIQGIEPWIEAGVSPQATLQSMTGNAARLLGVEKERGFLRPGLAADIIAVPENPLENLKTLKNVIFVMKDGVVIKKT